MTALALYRSTVGKKAVMAASGFVLFGFVVGHMLGNMQVYLGPEKLNAYAAFLKNTPALLWGTRILLLIATVAHVVSAVQLTQLQKSARPHAYAQRRPLASTLGSRTMIYTGIVLFLFIVYHLLHFTFGNAHPSFSHEDVYGNVIAGFRVVPVSAFYIAAMLALGLHMRHGVWSVFQSLGVNSPKTDRSLRRFATGLTAIVVLGNISVPVAVLAGWIQ